MTLTQRPYREERIPSLAGGMNDTVNETLLKKDQSPNPVNIEFNRETAQSAKGAIKFNNQVAPRCGFRSRIDQSYSPLFIQAGMGVPLRGYGYIPFSADYDIGGNFAVGAGPSYHSRIGKSFEVNVSFRLPPEEKLYEQPTLGTGAPATPDANFNPPHGYDEALDECFTIIQKGGDRTAPMSWALGIVNIGNGSGISPPTPRVSNYALCWIWFDAPGWGANAPGSMKYNLTTGQDPVTGGNSAFSTQALRAFVIHKYIEPGRRYSVAVQLQKDSGSPGGIGVNTSWNFDGYFKVWVTTDDSAPEVFSLTDSGGGVTAVGIEAYKGPVDSPSYFLKYGIRYSANDALYWGLGFRPHVWRLGSFIPWGMDAAPLQYGGYRMIDRSANTITAIYGGGNYTLTASKAALGDAFISFNFRGLAASNTNGGTAPMGFWGGSNYLEWAGLGSAGTPFNSEALRGYRFVTTADFNAGAPLATGMILSALQWTDGGGGGPWRMTILSGNTIGTFTNQPMLVQAFRWHQRELDLCELRIWSQPRNYADTDTILAARRAFSLRSSIEMDDMTEPDIQNLLARWGASDAEGCVLRESVADGIRAGHLAPFGLGIGPGGTRGDNVLFLSGEGEALKIDFSSNPIAQKVIEENLQSGSQGFGFEITCVFPEAFYAIQGPAENLPDGGVTTGSRPRFVPDIVTWDVPDPDNSGQKSVPRTILSLTHRALRNDQNQTPFMGPVPWSVEVANRTDQENSDPVVHSDLLPWYVSGAADVTRYDKNASWVGKTITIQVGIQPVAGSTDTYDVYVAMRPKLSIYPQSGDAGDSEFAYFSKGGTTYDVNPAYFTGAHITIRAKDLVRSVVTVGGRWAPRAPQSSSQGLGYSELNCRMLVDEIRIFGCSPAGTLPTTNGGAPLRNGKLVGLLCLPGRKLTPDDMTLPVGHNLFQANVTDGSATVLPAGGGKFFTAEASTTSESVKNTIFAVKGDIRNIAQPDTVPKDQVDLYRTTAVAADGSSLTLGRNFRGATRGSAACASIRLLYYTAFDDDISQHDLSLGAGNAYDPATSTIANATIVDDMWTNVSPINVNAGLRIYSPLGRGTLRDLQPRWTRGTVTPRHNPILGITGRNGELYCATQGAVYRGDDRWRPDGPTLAIQSSLEFLSRPLKPALPVVSGTGLSSPLHADRVEFLNQSVGHIVIGPLAFVTSNTDAFYTSYDCWVKLKSLYDFQTWFYIGDLATDPSLTAGSAGNVVHIIVRFRKGVPEFAFGSTASPAVEKGLYIASGSTAIPTGQWVHIRWSLASRANGTVVKIPDLKVNGKNSTVTVNAQDSAIGGLQASDWILYSHIVQPGVNGQVLLGVARDSYRVPEDEPAITSGGQQIMPQRFHGFLHGLGGSLAEVSVNHQTSWSGSQTGTPAPNFDPFLIDYTTAISNEFHVLGATAEGVGPKLVDTASSRVGIIKSSPFRSVYHELGRSTGIATWAQFGTQLYVTNGGAPVVIIQGEGRKAGVVPPGIKPTFSLQRFPVWESNVRDLTTNTGVGNDPINAAVAGATPIYHYRSTGNAYFRQELSSTDATLFAWTKDRYFGFKCYWRPESVSGRITIWRRGQSKESGGPFVECRDGKCFFGWYDAIAKQEVSISTDSPVFQPGKVHLIYIRKRFPQADLLEGNWVNSYWGAANIRRIATDKVTPGVGSFINGETITGATSLATGRVLRYVQATSARDGFMEYAKVSGDFTNGETLTGGTSLATAKTKNPVNIIAPMHDSMVVRVLRTAAPTDTTITALDEMDSVTYVGRNSISFTTELAQARVSGTTASGQVMNIGTTFNTNAGSPDQITAAVGTPFHAQMIGMYFQFGSGANAGTLYRIAQRISLSVVRVVVAGSGAAPGFGTATGLTGSVFTGITLVKSAGFDTSIGPSANGDVDFLGGEVQVDPLAGFTAHAGRAWSPGWTCVDPAAAGTNAKVFEDVSSAPGTGIDPMDVGTDALAHRLYDGISGDCGPLHFNGTDGVNEPTTPAATFWCADGQTYNGQGYESSSQPNGTQGNPAFINKVPGTTPKTLASTNANPRVAFVQDPSLWGGNRYIGCAFYDPIQDAVSNPGPILSISASAEDSKNPSGAIRFLLTGLPQRSGVQLWIYGSLANGDAATLFRVAQLDATSYSYAVSALEAQIGIGPPLVFSNFAPPSCKIVATTGDRIWYGALTVPLQLDGVMYSKAGQPVSLNISPTTGFFRVASGFGDEITGMAQLDQIMVIGKDHGLASATINDTENPIVETVSSGIGMIAPASLKSLDDRAFCLSERGIHMISRAGVTNLGVPRNISGSLEQYFSFVIDKRYSRLYSATINRQRDQYVLVARELGDTRIRNRISLEAFVQQEHAGVALNSFAPSSFRFARYQGPDLTAIGGFQATPGGIENLIGGTNDGFLVWLDRDDTQYMMIGNIPTIYGAPLQTAQAPIETTGFGTAAQLDLDLEGPRGSTARWLDAGGVERAATVLGTNGTLVLLDETAPAAIVAGQPVLLGVQKYRYETPWDDMGNPERFKQGVYLNLVFRGEPTGTLRVDIYTDLDANTVKYTQDLDLTQPKKQVVLGTMMATWWKAVIYSPFPTTGTKFELASLVWRISDADQD